MAFFAMFWGSIPYYPSQNFFNFVKKRRIPIGFSFKIAMRFFTFFSLKSVGLSPLDFLSELAF